MALRTQVIPNAEWAFSVFAKDTNMKLPIETKPALWGAVAGAIALAFVGFKVGGWQTASQSETKGTQLSRTAVATALAPVCADKFRKDGKHDANLAELKKTETWSRGTFIEKGGWATMPGATAPDSDAANACAVLLVGA
jgi:hypothetical protein